MMSSLITHRISLLLGSLVVLTSCEKPTPPPPPPASPAPTAPTAPAAPAQPPAAPQTPAPEAPPAAPEAGQNVFLSNPEDWKTIENGVSGPVTVKDGILKLGLGDGVTGAKYVGKQEIPVVDYALSWEAQRTDGVDFFAAATFPVRSVESCATFINGGWGGSVTGISCIESMAANENNTTSSFVYEDNKWYKFTVMVTKEMLVVDIDGKRVVNTNISEKKISLRPGDIEACAPFGFATYMSKGEIRNISIRKLKPNELPTDPDAY